MTHFVGAWRLAFSLDIALLSTSRSALFEMSFRGFPFPTIQEWCIGDRVWELSIATAVELSVA
jgi:hypothetical protein